MIKVERPKILGGRHTSYTLYGDDLKTSSMQLGKRARKLGWEYVQQPAVYEIVCSGSGRSYIGSSTRPDLRRAVHLYWLKNYWKFHSSNVFFGNLAVAEDVKTYGVDSFYMDIVISAPGASSAELLKLEKDYLAKKARRKTYNRIMKEEDEKLLHHFDSFCHLDEDIKVLYDEYIRLQAIFRFESLHRKESVNLIAREREKLIKERSKRKIGGELYVQKVKELNMVREARRKYLKDSKESYYAARKELTEKLKQLEKIYADAEQPMY